MTYFVFIQTSFCCKAFATMRTLIWSSLAIVRMLSDIITISFNVHIRWMFTCIICTTHSCNSHSNNSNYRTTMYTSTDLLRQLHWLPIKWLTKFKLASLTYKALHTGHPPYLTKLLQYHKPARSTRSSASHSLSVPCHNFSFGSRAFRISAPKIWNSLPPHILQSQTLSSFRPHLKTHYFQSAYPAPSSSTHPNAPWFSSETLALYKSLTCLLTSTATQCPM